MAKTIKRGILLFISFVASVALAQNQDVEDFLVDTLEKVAEEEQENSSESVQEPQLERMSEYDSEDNRRTREQIEKLNRHLESISDFSPYIYSDKGRRSPFEAPEGFSKIENVLGAVDQNSEEEPGGGGLEGFHADSFTLTAILWDIQNPKGLVRAPSGENYMVEEGTRIGRNDGYVAEIREGEVIIIEPEYLAGKDKKKHYRTLVLKLGG